MRRFLFVLLFSLLSFTAAAQSVSFNGVKQDVLVDVRTPAEFHAGHIPGAVNVPLNELESGILKLHNINKNSRILVYCRSGRRSAMAYDALTSQGFKRVYDGGGMISLKSKLKACHTLHC